MKRAEVWQEGRIWCWLTYETSRNRPYEKHRLGKRLASLASPLTEECDGAPTHAAALTAAIEAVGLGKTEKEKR